ncbi:MAG: tRNA dihydrouridine synthase DusB [Candidatus Undinarchaeales archaeon]|nr:tRNA dihydrouridine synthase DusB [Candidatus Undinarchaeales archaeon]MDP7494299.1 tRNA dihydrouridine synthase DusB [Candidatus Undinarchaeales archaeon]
MFKIGRVKIDPPVIFAPMAGVSDMAFRLMCKEYGAGLVVTEMISTNALERNNAAMLKLAETTDEERPVAIQLFGSRTEAFVKSAKLIQNQCDIIDVNAGCPVRKIMSQGAGSALLKRPKHLASIVKSLAESSSRPVTVKMRTGLTYSKADPVKIARHLEEAGASAVTLHARTTAQGYAGKADWDAIHKLKESLSIPVIGNGDVRSPEDAKRMLDETGCDAVMVGRAALGDPQIFERIKMYLEKGELLSPPTEKEKAKTFLKYQQLRRSVSDGNFTTLREQASRLS